ncbi:helix-turn-helix domain-containing protein [Pacificimonas sp. ICDLI1SI03]
MTGNVIPIRPMSAWTKPEDCPNRIREVRLALGLTLEQLAEKTGMHMQTLHRLETGGSELKMSHARQIAEALEMAPVDLLSPADNPNGPRSPDEVRLLRRYRQMDGRTRSNLLVIAENIDGQGNGRDADQQDADAA